MTRKVLHSLALLLVLGSWVIAGNPEFERIDSSFESDTPALAASNHPPSPKPLESVTDTLSSYVAGQVATHQIGFELPRFQHDNRGGSRPRNIAISFPRGFNIRNISEVTVVATDSTEVLPEIKKISIFF